LTQTKVVNAFLPLACVVVNFIDAAASLHFIKKCIFEIAITCQLSRIVDGDVSKALSKNREAHFRAFSEISIRYDPQNLSQVITEKQLQIRNNYDFLRPGLGKLRPAAREDILCGPQGSHTYIDMLK